MIHPKIAILHLLLRYKIHFGRAMIDDYYSLNTKVQNSGQICNVIFSIDL